MYITIDVYSAHGHELSGCVRADTYNLVLFFASYYYAPCPRTVYDSRKTHSIESGAPY